MVVAALPSGRNVTPQAQRPLIPFRAGTRQQIIPLDSMSFAQFAQTKTIQLPQVGFLSRIFLRVYGNGTAGAAYTTGSGTPSGTWAAYPYQPWGMISRIRLWTANVTDYWDTSAYSAYLYSLAQRRISNIMQDASSTNDSTANRANVYAALSGSTAASTGYKSGFILEIPLYLDALNMLGMLQLQTLRSRLNLSLSTGLQTDVTAVTGVSVTPSIQVDAWAEVFSEPDPAQYSWPDLTWVNQVTDDFLPVTATGPSVYRPVVGTQYARLLGVFENNGAAADSTKIDYTRIKFGQSNTPYDESYPQHLARNFWETGITLPESMFMYDFTRGTGVPGIYDPRDVFATERLADFQHVLGVNSGLSLTNASIRYVRQMISQRN